MNTESIDTLGHDVNTKLRRIRGSYRRRRRILPWDHGYMWISTPSWVLKTFHDVCGENRRVECTCPFTILSSWAPWSKMQRNSGERPRPSRHVIFVIYSQSENVHIMNVTRRAFLKRLFNGVLVSSVSPFFESVGATERESMYDSMKEGLTLKQMVAKKIHHGQDRYINPFQKVKHGNLWRVLYWKLFARNRFRDYYAEERVIPVKVDWGRIVKHKGLSITFVKHACVLIKDFDHTILVDPVFFGLFWPITDFSPLSFAMDQLPRPGNVLVTHGHYDHLDIRSLAAMGHGLHVVTPVGYREVFREFNRTKRTQLDWFDSLTQDGRRITLLPCNHWTMRSLLKGPNRSLWGSYLISTAAGVNIFIGGDTAYFEGFRELGKEFRIDLAIFNLGAYEPRWFMASSHMNPRETIQAFQDLNAKRFMVVHWGTFRLGDEPVHFPPLQIKEELKKKGIMDRLVDLKHGQTAFYDDTSNSFRME